MKSEQITIEHIEADVGEDDDDNLWKSYCSLEEAEQKGMIEIENVTLNEQENIIFTMISEQEAKMRSVVLKNDESETSISVIIEDVMAEIGTCDVPADGSCFHYAAAHQLFHEKIGSVEHLNSGERLRSEVVDYIKSNRAEFEINLRNRVLDERKGKPPASKSAMKRACTDLLNRLAKNAWGGPESILALSRLYKTNIILFSENSNCYTVGSFNSDYEKCVLIAYTSIGSGSGVRNHYQSICSINQDIIFSAMKTLLNVITQNTNGSVVDLDTTSKKSAGYLYFKMCIFINK